MNDTPHEDRPARGGNSAARRQGQGPGKGQGPRGGGGGSQRRDGDRRGADRRGGQRDATAHGGGRGRSDDRHVGERGGPHPARTGQPRPRQEDRPRDPEVPEDVDARQLSKEARGRLRGLSKDNADRVGAHLVMAGRLLDVDPELAYEHAQAAVRKAGRIDVVREAAGIAAYRTGRYAEALRELRTVRRLNGSSEHLPLMADAERGLERPERAIALAQSEEAATLDATGRTELAIVVSGARSDLGEHDAALTVLDRIPPGERQGDLGLRVLQARAVALEAAGREAEAAAVLSRVDPVALARATGAVQDDEDYVVYDTFDEEADDEETQA